MKKTILVITMALAILISARFGYSLGTTETKNLYAMTTVVTKVDGKIITCTDFNGISWEFETEYIEDWMVGDYASLVMSDNGTKESIYDDVVISAEYDGWLDGGFGLTDNDEFVIEMD